MAENAKTPFSFNQLGRAYAYIIITTNHNKKEKCAPKLSMHA
jgi:hypothetical protein